MISATMVSRIAGPGLHHAVGDAAGEVVLEERPGLAHHVPVVLPADAVRDVGGDRLVGEQVLRCERGRAHDQQHAAPCRAAAASDRANSVSGLGRGDSVTMRPMKTGIRVSSSATTKPADEQRGEQRASPGARNANRTPSARPAARAARATLCRLQQPLEEREHGRSEKGRRGGTRSARRPGTLC